MLKNISWIAVKSYQGRQPQSERADEKERQRDKLKCVSENLNRFTNENEPNPADIADILVCYCRERILDARSCDCRICIKNLNLDCVFASGH